MKNTPVRHIFILWNIQIHVGLEQWPKTVTAHKNSLSNRQLFPGNEFVILKWRRIIYNGIYNNTQAYETPPVPRRVYQALTVLRLSRGKLNANMNCTHDSAPSRAACGRTRPLIDQTLLTIVTGTTMRNGCSSIIRASYWRSPYMIKTQNLHSNNIYLRHEPK